MNALLILDKDARTELAEQLSADIVEALRRMGHRGEVVELGRDDAAPCFGCLRCLTKHPGRCVSKDKVGELIERVQTFDLTVFLTPILFGHFSSTITNAMNRGTGCHNWQVVIGYGEDVDDVDRGIFLDLTAKHRGSADVVHPGMDKQVDVYVTRGAADSEAIRAALASAF